jgi:hypothetical protein
LTSDAGFVGTNCSSLANPGQSRSYKFYARAEGNYLIYSNDDANGATGNPGQQQAGLFGSINVEPANAEYYRSQVTRTDLQQATFVACAPGQQGDCVQDRFSDSRFGNMALTKALDPQGKQRSASVSEHRELKECGNALSFPLWTLTTQSDTEGRHTEWSSPVVLCGAKQYLHSLDGHPIVNYQARYATGVPVLSMLQSTAPSAANGNATLELAHSDLTAIITGKGAGRFPDYQNSTLFGQNPALPDRREPFREFTIHYHVSNSVVQPFAAFSEGPLANVLGAGADGFGINYGMAAIGPEVLANRLGVGPEKNCVECKFEEFFLSSWAVGDPAMLVDNPAGGDPRGSAQAHSGQNKAVQQGTHVPTSSSVAATSALNSVVVPNFAASPAAAPAPPKATMAYFPDDPSNVYHSYMRDHVKFRISNISVGQPHVHHQHAH